MNYEIRLLIAVKNQASQVSFLIVVLHISAFSCTHEDGVTLHLVLGTVQCEKNISETRLEPRSG